MATDLVVNIASQFLGKKAFLDADKATKKLTGSVKTLGRTLGVSLSAAAVLAYGKASVKAASEDIKAQKLLANSLKNVGLAYATVDVESFISQMQSQTGILDDQLRPAFAKLAGVTGSVAKTQKLLALAFDVSSGSGLDYASTVDLLSQAYLGNTKGLKQLNLGLTQAEIKAMSFDEVMALLNERFAGSGKAALDTYVGQMSLLSASASNASEIIGVSLLGAIDSLTGSDGIANVGTDIENAARSLANFVNSIVYLKEQIATIPGAGIVKGVFGLIGNLLGRFSPQRAAELLKEIKGPQSFKQPMTIASQDTGRANAAAQKAAETAAKKRAAELLAVQNKTLKSQQAALKLAKAKSVFDLTKISIEAALKGKITEQERLRLLLMKAIGDENVTLIDKYTKALNEAQVKTKELQVVLDKVKATTFLNPASTVFYAGLSAAEIALEKFKEKGGFRLKFDATDYYLGLSESQVKLEKFKESGGFRLKWDATDYYLGLSKSQVELEKFKESGKFRLGWDATDYYAGLTQSDIELEKFKESGKFRLGWDATSYDNGLTQSEAELENFKNSGDFRLGFDGTVFYAGLSAAQISLQQLGQNAATAAAAAAAAVANAAGNLGAGADAQYDQAAAAAALAAATAAAAAATDALSMASNSGSSGGGSGGGSNGFMPMSPMSNNNQNYTHNEINVNAGVIGNEDVIVQAVQGALNQIARLGNTTTYAGALPV